MSLKDVLDDICSDPVDEVDILRKIFEAYDGTFEASLTVSTACNASIHKTSWDQVMRHVGKIIDSEEASDKWKSIAMTIPNRKAGSYVDPLLERASEFTACVFRPDFQSEERAGLLSRLNTNIRDRAQELLMEELLPNIRNRARELRKQGFSKKAQMYNRALQTYEDIPNGDLRANVGAAFIMTLEAYQFRDPVVPKRTTIDDFVNTLQDCDIRLGKALKNEEAGGLATPSVLLPQHPPAPASSCPGVLLRKLETGMGGRLQGFERTIEGERSRRIDEIVDHPYFDFDEQQDKI